MRSWPPLPHDAYIHSDWIFARHLVLHDFEERKAGKGTLPIIASACPGWISYPEKAYTEILPFVSRTEGPQQVTGTLVKERLGGTWGKQRDEITLKDQSTYASS